MIQKLDPPGVWGLLRRGLHFLLKNRRNKRNEKKGAFSIIRHRNSEKVDSKDGAKDFKVYFAKPETLQLFLGKWLEKQYRNSAGAPIFAKKNKDPRLRALEAPMVQLTKQIRNHYFVNKEKRKVDYDDDTVKVDKRVVARLSGGKIEWEDDNLRHLFGDDEDM